MLPDTTGVSKRFAGQLAQGQELLLLDGLDELPSDNRAGCITAIRDYLGTADLPLPIVVACRSQEYAAIGARLPIAGAVELEPLDLPAVEQAISKTPDAHGVLSALQTDELLRDLAETPLMVNILLLAHSGQEVPAAEGVTLEGRRKQLWFAYVRRMLQQRGPEREEPQQTLRWLRWLAEMMRGRGEIDFLVDDMQPEILMDRAMSVYRRAAGLIFAMIGVPLWWLFLTLAVRSNQTLITYTPFIQWFPTVFSFLLGWMYWITGSDKKIFREEKIIWSSKSFFSNFKSNISKRKIEIIFLSLSVSTIGTLGTILDVGVENVKWNNIHFLLIMYEVPSLFLFSLLTGLQGGLSNSWKVQDLSNLIYPLQGIYATLKSGAYRVGVWGLTTGFLGVILAIIILAIASLMPAFSYDVDGFILRLLKLFVGAFFIGMGIGGCLGFLLELFSSGLKGFLQHYILRGFMARKGLFPFRAVAFLDAMSARLLLERDGAVYRFRHLLLRDFVAELTDEEIERLAHESRT